MNGEGVKHAPVEKVVEAITRVPPDSSEMSVKLIYHYTINDSCTSYSTGCVESNLKFVKGRAHICFVHILMYQNTHDHVYTYSSLTSVSETHIPLVLVTALKLEF